MVQTLYLKWQLRIGCDKFNICLKINRMKYSVEVQIAFLFLKWQLHIGCDQFNICLNINRNET